MADQNKKCSIIKYAVNIYHSLPRILARPAKPLGVFGGLVPVVYRMLPVSRMRISPGSGGFGMVGFTFTIAYQPLNLGRTSGLIAFTSQWPPALEHNTQ